MVARDRQVGVVRDRQDGVARDRLVGLARDLRVGEGMPQLLDGGGAGHSGSAGGGEVEGEEIAVEGSVEEAKRLFAMEWHMSSRVFAK